MEVNTACEPFPEIAGGCSYRSFPGLATVIAVETPGPGEYSCTDASRVRMTFEPEDPAAAMACALTLSPGTAVLEEEHRLFVGAGANPPTSCLDGIGVTVGADLPASLWIIERGGCSPTTFNLELDTSACTEQCVYP
jgi:hypothetical protein